MEDKEDDDIERVIKIIVFNEHVVVTDSIKDATSTDETLKLIKEIMKDNKWEHHKHRPEIKSFHQVGHELHQANGLILRNRQVVIPEILQSDTIRAAHSMGHFGMTRTKQMLRNKYWFPALNSMVENIISKCFQCQLISDEQKYDTVKPTKIPEIEWNTLSVDFEGPYPDGHYNLVVIDKRTRYPLVEQI